MAVFHQTGSVEINRARIEHIQSLNLDWTGREVFETGAGGRGDFTKFMVDHGATVTCQDIRRSNLDQIVARVDGVKTHISDLNQEGSIPKPFDIIFCYGTLYHLSKPDVAVKEMSLNDRELILLSTCTDPREGSNLTFCTEEGDDQAFDRRGCRPTRQWIVDEFSKYFKYVLICKTRPNHPDYPSDWSKSNLSDPCRWVFLMTNNENLIDYNLWTTIDKFAPHP